MKGNRLSFQEMKEMENYVEKHINGMRVPINMNRAFYGKFNVLKLVYEKGGRFNVGEEGHGLGNRVDKDYPTPRSSIRPVPGGFIISIAALAPMFRDYRHLLAHELAHTYFYEYKGPKEIPIHSRRANEEGLCNYGARAILVPKSAISNLDIEKVRLKDILRISTNLNVWPQCLIARLSTDLRLLNVALLVYELREGMLRKKKEVSNLGIDFSLLMLGDIRKCIRVSIEKNVESFDNIFLGPASSGNWFDMEIIQEKASVFSKRSNVYILLKLRK